MRFLLRRMKTARNWILNRDMVFNLVAVLATVAAVGVITSGRYSAGGDDQQPETKQPEMVFVSDWTELGSAGFRTGPDSAAVTIVVFIDLTCGACRVVDSLLVAIQESHPGRLATVARHFPLNQRGYQAALAAECDPRDGNEPLRSLIFRSQDSLGTLNWNEIATRAGVRDITSFEACMSNPDTHATLWRDIHAGDVLYVRSTPTMVINDSMIVRGIPSLSWLSSHIRDLL